MVEVTCAIIEDGGKILVVQRSATMSHPLKWEFPGGKILRNESYEACIKREIKEELDIVIEAVAQLPIITFDYGETLIGLLPFVCRINEGELKLTEHADSKWCDLDELLRVDWLEADILVLEEYLEWRLENKNQN